MSLLELNLAAIAEPLAQTLRESLYREDEVQTTARDGSLINGLRVPAGARYFHSRYAPRREAERLAEQYQSGFLLVLGAGMGYHMEALLRAGRRVLLVEPSPALLKRSLQSVRVDEFLGSGRLQLAVEPDQMTERLLSSYTPALHGNLITVPLQGRLQSEPTAFAPFFAALSEFRESIETDIATQARFGLLWARNLCNNLVYLARSAPAVADPALSVAPTVLVAAAGPSLERQLPWIVRNRPNLTILASDTALPALVRHRITPDLVLSIDANPVSYHHFLLVAPEIPPVFAELSCPPSVTHTTRSVVPLLSANPLHTVFRRCGLPFPFLDTSSGTVTQAAVELAPTIGAESVVLAGADLSYPGGTTYARGTYVSELFSVLQSRFLPIEHQHYRFLMDRPGLSKVGGKSAAFSTPVLTRFREQLLSRADTFSIPIYALPGGALSLPLPPPAPVLPPARDPRRFTRERVNPDVITSAVHTIHVTLKELSTSADLAPIASSTDDSLAASVARALIPISYAISGRRSIETPDEPLRAACTTLEALLAGAARRLSV